MIDGKGLILSAQIVIFFLIGGWFFMKFFLTLDEKVKWREFHHDHEIGVGIIAFLAFLPFFIAWLIHWRFF